MSNKKRLSSFELTDLLLGGERERDKAYGNILWQCAHHCHKIGRERKLNKQDIEDILIESLIKLLMAVANNKKFKKSITAYFISIFRNTAIDEITKRKKKPLISRIDGDFIDENSTNAFETDAQSLTEKGLDNIFKAMLQLDEKCREYISKHHLYGWRLKQIAEKYNIKETTLNTGLARCRKKLKRFLMKLINGK